MILVEFVLLVSVIGAPHVVVIFGCSAVGVLLESVVVALDVIVTV